MGLKGSVSGGGGRGGFDQCFDQSVPGFDQVEIMSRNRPEDLKRAEEHISCFMRTHRLGGNTAEAPGGGHGDPAPPPLGKLLTVIKETRPQHWAALVAALGHSHPRIAAAAAADAAAEAEKKADAEAKRVGAKGREVKSQDAAAAAARPPPPRKPGYCTFRGGDGF